MEATLHCFNDEFPTLAALSFRGKQQKEAEWQPLWSHCIVHDFWKREEEEKRMELPNNKKGNVAEEEQMSKLG